MTIQILDKAEDDLVHGFQFYERQQPGLGSISSKVYLLTWNRCRFMGAFIVLLIAIIIAP